MTYETPQIDHEERRRFLKVLGITGAAAVGGDLAIDELRENAAEPGADLATMGRAIRNDLSGSLNAEVLGTGLASIGTQIERIPELGAAGFPAADSTAYQEVAEPVWTVYDELTEVGFLASAEENLPPFTAGHIESTARALVGAEPLAGTLLDSGFTEEELTTLFSSVATSRERLSLWMPTRAIPEDVEFDLEHVAPLHQRAMGGAALWIDDLDTYLWQAEYLIPEAQLQKGLWDVKEMLGGAALFTAAAHDIAGPEQLTDSQLTAALTAGTASMILGQEDLANDVYRLRDDERTPMQGGEAP